MRRERLDDDEFVLVDPVEFDSLFKAWTEAGGEVDDVGNGIHLFMVEGSVQFRVRIDMTS